MSTIHAYAATAPHKTLQPFEFDPGDLGSDQVEIKVTHCGICHSDLSMLDNEWGMSQFPLVPGHEAVGTVLALGENAKGLKVGQRVGIGWSAYSCLHCHECLSGDHNLCPTSQGTIAGMKDIVAPMYDQGYSALLEDLFQRGLLDKTMVACLSEFGRTPKVNAAGGRDHWPNCWTVYFAGGGVKGGRIVGKSDDIGAYPVERPVKPSEVVATIFKSLGLDLETHLPGPQSRPFPLVDYGTQPIKELF
jgi:uncharacterized CHY-type Zn-finger protein